MRIAGGGGGGGEGGMIIMGWELGCVGVGGIWGER